jgi:hypothetical protein
VKPRMLKTQKILVGLLVAGTGAIPAAASAAGHPFHPPRDAGGYPLVGNLIRKGGGGGRAAPPPDGEVSPALLVLRSELGTQTEAKALARTPHFRPLCDDDGYPLVGNLMRKSPAPYQPSQFCAAVRKAKTSA